MTTKIALPAGDGGCGGQEGPNEQQYNSPNSNIKLFASSFLERTYEEIRIRLFRDNPKAKQTGDKINHLSCPVCSKSEAWAHYDRPGAIICPRLNECGEITKTRDTYPDLFTDFIKRFPSTRASPNATATALIESRALDPSLIKFTQGTVTEADKKYATVKIKVGDGIFFHRLIDYTGKNKARIHGKYTGTAYEAGLVENADEVVVVEGVFDAISLEQSGRAAIATLSASTCPTAYYASNKNKTYILAFDNDRAGRKAIEKHIREFEQLGIEYQVALTPKGRDWNDLKQAGLLGQDKIKATLEECFWRGQLYQAKTAGEYFEIHYARKKINGLVFEFRYQTYRGIYKPETKQKNEEFIATRLADCTLKILFSIVDKTVDYQNKSRHVVEIRSKNGNTDRLEISADDFANVSHFRERLSNYRKNFFGNTKDLLYVHEYLHRFGPILLAEVNFLGFDPKSNCFIFSNFLYDNSGERHSIKQDGYFDKQRVFPMRDGAVISGLSEINFREFVQTLSDAYGYKALLALGFYITTTFSHIIFKNFGFFPFLSFYGDPDTGKTALIQILNRCFFIDWEGITMTRANTQKGELRKISQRSSIVVALLESRKDKVRFDFDGILALYNRNSLQLRAQTSNDNSIHELPFQAALAFVQNREPFTEKAAAERLISLHFPLADTSDETFNQFEKLLTYTPAQLTSVGDLVIRNRSKFENEFVAEIEDVTKLLKSDGRVKVDRVAKNHAVCLAGIHLLNDLVHAEIDEDDLFQYVAKIARKKARTARTETLLADHFFDCIAKLNTVDGVVNEKGYLIVHMPTALKAIKDNWDKSKLFEQLKMCDGFVEKKSSRAIDGNSRACWIFKSQE